MAALKAHIVHNRRALIVRRSPEEIGAGTLECPGGKPELGETLTDAVLRAYGFPVDGSVAASADVQSGYSA